MHCRPNEDFPDDAHLSQVSGGFDVHIHNSPRAHQLDDVFASASASPINADVHNAIHASDVRRLETDHETAGYREGITAAKESSIQAGFDEGFSLGATIGLRAGQLLGMIEGIAEALNDQEKENHLVAVNLLQEARGDLNTDRIFSAEYWAPDGNWKYEVAASGDTQIYFRDVANAHPLIMKWSRLVDEQSSLWHVQVTLLDDETGTRLEAASTEPLDAAVPLGGKQALEW